MALTAAYIVPHPPLAVANIGRGEEKKISATLQAFQEVARRIAEHQPDTIIFISPHSAYYGDWIYMGAGDTTQGDLADFRAPEITFQLRYNTSYREALITEAKAHDIPAGPLNEISQPLDHGIMVPLSFINAELDPLSYQAVSIGGSGLPASQLIAFGRCIARMAEEYDESIVLVASGDLSHKLKKEGPYGFDPAGPLFDARFKEIITSGKLLDFATIDSQVREDAAECGLSGFIMLAGALDEATSICEEPFGSELLSLEGPFGVGYGVAAFERQGHTTVDPLVQLARKTITRYAKSHTRPTLPVLPNDLPQQAGCFVSIHTASTGELRGCIGTTEPTRSSLAEEIVENAISAATRDPRFPAIGTTELEDLDISVDVLFPAEPATISDLDPQRYGVIVTQGFKRGLLLPDLEGVDTIEKQVHIACMKAGIDPRSSFATERFEVVRHTEEGR